MEQLTRSKLGKEHIKAIYYHPAYITSMQSTLCEMLGCINHNLESRLMGEISITSDMQMLTTPKAEGGKELRSLCLRMKEENEKAGLKLNIQKTKIKTSSPITSGQTDGDRVKAITNFIFLGSKITADGDCSHKIKRCLLLGRRAITNLDSVLKSKDMTLATRICI